MNNSAPQLARIKNLIAVMLVDGKGGEAEKRFLAERCAALGIPPTEFQRLLSHPGSVPFVVPPLLDDKLEHVVEMVQMMRTDGRVEASELSWCMTVAQRLGFSQALAKRLVEISLSALAGGLSLGAATSLLKQATAPEASVEVPPGKSVTPTLVAFDSIPEPIKDALASAIRGQGANGFRCIKRLRPPLKLAGLALLGLLLVLVALHALYGDPDTGFSFHPERAAWRMLLLCLGATAVFFVGFEVLRIVRSRLKPAVLLNPALLIKTGLDGAALVVVPLAKIGSFVATPKGVSVLGPRREVILELSSLKAHVLEFQNAHARYRSEQALNPALLANHDWLKTVEPARAARRGRRWGLSLLAGSALGAVLGLPLGIAVYLAGLLIGEARQWERFEQRTSYWGANQYFDFTTHAPDPLGLVAGLTDREARRTQAVRAFDEGRFQEAVATNDVSRFRSYIKDSRRQSGPDTIPVLGTHVADARAKISALYAVWSSAYAQHARAHGASPHVVQGVEAVLAWLAADESLKPDVGLVFVHPAELDVDRLTRAATAAGEVAKVGVLFTPELNLEREQSMTQALRSALGGYFKPEQLWLTSRAEPGRPRLLVHSRLSPTGADYFRVAELRLPLARRKAYPGVALDFNFRLQLPDDRGDVDPRRGLGIYQRANPAPQFSVPHDSTGKPSDKAVYQVMVETAFHEFEDEVVLGLGFQPKPRSKPVPVPVPEPIAQPSALGKCQCRYRSTEIPPSSCDDPRCGPVLPEHL